MILLDIQMDSSNHSFHWKAHFPRDGYSDNASYLHINKLSLGFLIINN